MANDSYSAPTGAAIYAGITTQPSIAGSVWTPRRDGAGAVLAADWVGLPLNTWLDVGTAVLNDVIETPHLVNSSGGDSAPSIVTAWGGAAWDYTNQSMYIAGGGHGDSSAREMGIYKLNAEKMAFSRIRDRDPLSQLQCWDTGSNTLVAAEKWNPYNAPLLNGVPGTVHTYYGLVWIPPATMGNTSGGLFYPGSAKAVYNLDTGAWSVCHWKNPLHDATDWSDCAAFIDGSKIYGPRASWYHWRFDLTATEATDWDAASFGAFNGGYASATVQCSAASACWSWLRERREHFGFGASGFRTRVRYGQALDAAATVWTSYSDTITLTSSDGSHSDFNATNLAGGGSFYAAGSAYDHSTETLYVQANNSGGQLYTITGLSGNTWTTAKIAGTGALRTNTNGTYGRLRMATLSGKKILIRLSSTTTPAQVMRVS